MLIDSHCHLNFLDSPVSALEAARAGGVGGFLCVGVDKGGIDDVCALAESNVDVWASIGQHPNTSEKDLSWIPDRIAKLGDNSKVIALGEMGLDYSQCLDDREEQLRQISCFEYQLALAESLGYPVIIHTRDAECDTASVLANFSSVQGVMHCFTESWALAEQALDLGYYISMSGIVTFKSAGSVREVASRIPQERLLIETDSPWLAPVPYRGKSNQPLFVAETAKFLVKHLGWEMADFERKTQQNFFRLFARAEAIS